MGNGEMTEYSEMSVFGRSLTDTFPSMSANFQQVLEYTQYGLYRSVTKNQNYKIL